MHCIECRGAGRILHLIEPLFHSRPDLSVVLSSYISRFPQSHAAELILHDAIRADPVFDATAGDYVLALDVCATQPMPRSFTRAVSRLIARSEERSPLLAPAELFLCKRQGRSASVRTVETENNPITAGKLIDFLLSSPRHTSLRPSDLQNALKKFATTSPDEDLSRYCTYLLLSELKVIPGQVRQPGALLVRHLGHPVPPRTSLLLGFFADIFGVRANLNWERLLGKRAHSELQRRGILIRGKWSGNPSVMVTVLDNFNDLLLQRFSRRHSALRPAFRRAAGKNAVPDYGAWLRHPVVGATLPKATPILVRCHELRLKAEIAHSTMKRTGKFTRAVTYREKNEIVHNLKVSYLEWLMEWRKL